MKLIAAACALGISAAAPAYIPDSAMAATVTFSRDASPLAETVRIERSGPYATGWSSLPDGPNTSDHQGRSAGVFEDGGMGRLRVWFDSAVESATVAIQDAADTPWFDRLVGRSNGSKATWREIGDDGNWLFATIHFDPEDARRVTLRTFQTPAAARAKSPQDGFGVKVCKR